MASRTCPTKPLAQSESKAKFFERLGLDEDSPRDRRIYERMKEEAAQGRSRISEQVRRAAMAAAATQASGQQNVGLAYVQETLVHREILYIYQTASRETRPYYDLGRITGGAAEENWVVRWLVWHVFRYRSGRDKNGREVQPSSAGGSSQRTEMWDPVRDALLDGS